MLTRLRALRKQRTGSPATATPPRWLARFLFRPGTPEEGTVTLGQRRIYVLVSRQGHGFGLMLVLIYIASINYSLSLGHALTFLLGSCYVVDMFLAYRNLHGLQLDSKATVAVFCGESAQYEVSLTNPVRRARHAIDLYSMVVAPPKPIKDKTTAPATGTPSLHAAPPHSHRIDIPANGSVSVKLSFPATSRGWTSVPRIQIKTLFPLGLTRAWSYWLPAQKVLVYPAPEVGAPPLPVGNGAGFGVGAGREEFAGVREYRPGDPLRQLAWRQIARLDSAERNLLISKAFDGGAAQNVDIDFSILPGNLPLEDRLSRMTAWVLQADQQGIPFAFRLGTLQLAQAHGAQQRDTALHALAVYGLESPA